MNYEFHVEEDFISEQERLDIRQTVLDLQQHWCNLRPERYSGIDFSTLGNALYIMEGEGCSVADINTEIRALLLDKFHWIYDRICNKIQSLTGQPTKIHPDLTAPGFHIVYKPSNTDDSAIGFFHNDMSILTYDAEANMETNRSVLIAIDVPSAGAYLLYRHEADIKKLNYKPAAFYQWDARLDHKVGGLKLLPGEHRITLQAHYYYNARMQCNLMYF